MAAVAGELNILRSSPGNAAMGKVVGWDSDGVECTTNSCKLSLPWTIRNRDRPHPLQSPGPSSGRMKDDASVSPTPTIIWMVQRRCS